MYRIEYFDDIILPLAMTEDDLSSGDVDGGIVPTLGGSLDAYGDRLVLPKSKKIIVNGMYTRPGIWVDHLGNFLVDESGNGLIFNDPNREIADRTDSLKSRLGKKKKLWRRNEWDGLRQYCYARLLSVSMSRTVANADNAIKVRAVFETSETGWAESVAISQSAVLSGAGIIAIEITNDAPLETLNPVLTITASASITALALRGMGSDWSITTSLSSGNVLKIDCDQMMITKNNAAAYDGFTLNSGHSAQNWIVISNGYNLWYVEADGSCSIKLEYYPRWP